MTTPATATIPEVLAPAGDWDALRAAAASGADAVYFGLPSFNARHRATNFTAAELPAVMEYLHDHNVRGYVAFNTLIFSDELEEAEEMIALAARAGVDALIVQDLGLVRLARAVAPDLPIHASTQMTLTEPRGIEFARGLGVERAILARELSIDEIVKIRKGTDLPLEVFVHGALCVAYSGQCLTSESLGGRSANRGQCAQACRMPYKLVVDGVEQDLGERAYLLSPLDLAAVDLVPRLLEAGVCSLKIEGRLKGPAYVSAATQTYRRAVVAAAAGVPFVPAPQELVDLQQSYSRGFSPGFLAGIDHQRLVPARFPKSRGVFVGVVAQRRGRRIVIEPCAEHPKETFLKPGDGVVFDLGHPEEKEPGGRLYGVREMPPPRAGGGFAAARWIELEFGRETPEWSEVVPGTKIWRTDDPTLLKRLESQCARGVARRATVDMMLSGEIGGSLFLSACERSQSETADKGLGAAAEPEAEAVWDGPLQTAEKRPATPESIREQLERMGDTPFELGELGLSLPPNVMVPKSVLNDLRRRVTTDLLAARRRRDQSRTIHAGAATRLRQAVEHVALPAPQSNREATDRALQPPLMSVLVRSLDQLDAVLAWQPEAGPAPEWIYCDFEDVKRYREAVDRGRAAGRKLGLCTIRILKPGEEGLLALIAKLEPDLVVVRNLGALKYFQEKHPAQALAGDYSLNVANELTADLLLKEGFHWLTPSYDLNWEQLSSMLQRCDAGRFEVVVHQHMPMFHMEHCVFAALLSNGKDHRDCGRPCDVHKLELRDHRGESFPVHPDVGCRNTVYNSLAQTAAEFLPRMRALGVRRFRVELLREEKEEIGDLLGSYARVAAGLEEGRALWRNLHVLNRLGVTRGTLTAT